MTNAARKTLVDKAFGWVFAPSVTIRMELFYGASDSLPRPGASHMTYMNREIPAESGSRRVTFAAGTVPAPADY